MSEYLVVGDADSIIAQVNANDLNHAKSSSTSRRLIELKARLLYPTTAVAEAVTVIQRPLNSLPTAHEAAAEFANSTQLIPVDHDIFSLAVNKYYTTRSSKRDTLFDAIVAACAQSYNADAIFSFDKYYKKLGYKLASEL